MELFGLVLFASLFLVSGYRHLRHSADMVAYTKSALGDCPVANQVAFFGGWPTGLFLALFSGGLVANESSVFAYGLAAFLAVVGLVFHRDLKNVDNHKVLALLGAALYIGSQVG